MGQTQSNKSVEGTDSVIDQELRAAAERARNRVLTSRYQCDVEIIAAEFAPLLSGLDLLPCGHRKADWVQFPPSADTFGGALDKGYCSSCQREAAAVSAALEQRS